MKKPYRLLSILIISIILLPVFFFSGYEIVRIGKNEKELELIYNKQLDAILFSINLYSDDIINTWASKLRKNILENDSSSNSKLESFFSENRQIKTFAIKTDSSQQSLQILFKDSSENSIVLEKSINQLFIDSSQNIEKLKTYFRGGYERNEPLGFSNKGNLFVAFLIKHDKNLQTCVIEIDPFSFIKDLLGQKIQTVAENRLNIGIYDSKKGNLIYNVGEIEKSSNFQHSKSIWLFPQLEMGISLKDKSLNSLSKEQSKTNLIFILLADFIFIIASFLVFRNIRKELKLTQIKTEFISNVSHEIRTPLALISMYAETLEMDRVRTEDKKKEYYQVIYNESQRLTGIVNRILNFSKMESGSKTYALQKCDLNEIVGKVMQNYSFHLKNKGFEYKIELASNLPQIMVDAESISDVLINLLDNAIKYSPNEKMIEVSTGIIDFMAFAQITDKGIGISKEDQKLVFDKFYRVTKGNLAHITKGTGLGLSIVKNIMEANHGKIELMSKPAEGSTFRILFPIN